MKPVLLDVFSCRDSENISFGEFYNFLENLPPTAEDGGRFFPTERKPSADRYKLYFQKLEIDARSMSPKSQE